ncbi:tetratricopeptide repeat protein [Brevundimonas sp.]|uniref:tetratricopeptide repeat protein n=1 Tax=Brevundimonas sp. TaxID=1871086 RepID=UPI00391D1A26
MKPIQRALGLLALGVVAIAVGIGVLRQGGGPNPISDPQAWVTWVRANPIASFVAIIGAVMAGVGAVAGLMQILGPKPPSRDEVARGHDRIRATVEHDGDATRRELAEVKAMLARIEAQTAGQGRPLAADERAQIETTLSDVAGSSGSDLEAARGALADQDPIALIDGLEAAASADAAAQLRRAGTIAYAVDVERARRIYSKIAALEPDDHWTHVLLGRLHRLAGDLTSARIAAQRALETSADDRDRSVAFTELGDVARAEGDLPGARKAYEDGLVIRRDLFARDPKNTGWLRDLSVSYDRIGDVAVAEGDLPGARKAYEDGLDIATDLSARDPKNADWLRDLSVSHNRIGDVAVAEGDLLGARKAYEDGLVIAMDLSARDPKNTDWLRDLSVSHNKIGDVARMEGDLPGARKAYEDGLVIATDLSARDPGNVEWKRDLSISHERLGDLAVAKGDPAAARSAYEKGLAIRRDLSARDSGNTEWKRDLAVSLAKLAQLDEAAGDAVAARRGFLEAEAVFRSILELSPTHAETRRMAELAASEAARLTD